jgi:hypothetical protein
MAVEIPLFGLPVTNPVVKKDALCVLPIAAV